MFTLDHFRLASIYYHLVLFDSISDMGSQYQCGMGHGTDGKGWDPNMGHGKGIWGMVKWKTKAGEIENGV